MCTENIFLTLFVINQGPSSYVRALTNAIKFFCCNFPHRVVFFFNITRPRRFLHKKFKQYFMSNLIRKR